MAAEKSLLARTSRVTGATLVSRVAGFVRDAATAAVLGVGPVADALAAALSFSLLARRLLAEGTFNLAFIPALAAAPGAEAARLSAATLRALVLVLAGVAAAGIVFMPQLIGLIAPGFADAGTRAADAILCGRIIMLYLPLAGIAALYGALANAAQRVLLPALAPLAANAVVLAAIAGFVLSGDLDPARAAIVISVASVAAGMAQALVMWIAARGVPALPGRAEGPLPWAAARGVLRAALPAFLFAGLGQFRLMIVAALVSGVPGAVAGLNYAQRLIDLPLGLVGASAGAVLVPLIAAGGRKEPMAGAGLAALAFALPAGVGLAVLAEPVVAVLFQRGSFDAADKRFTAGFVAVLALALPVQGLEKILAAAAFTAGAVRRAERIALLSLLGCGVVGLPLALWIGPHAAAGAVAVSALASVLALAPPAGQGRAMLALLAASLAMGAAVAALAHLWPGDTAGLAGAPRLAGLIGAGVLVYAACLLPLRAILRPPG